MRTSGILMHITSLPGPYGVGTMGKQAYAFVDFLNKAGQSRWQILPLTPTGYGDSPYQSCSAYAGNPYLIDLDMLVEEGLLRESELDTVRWNRTEDRVDFGILYQNRMRVLRLAYDRFPGGDAFVEFCGRNSRWLSDFALFMALKDRFGGKPWYQWEDGLKRRDPDAVWKARQELKDPVRFYSFVQYQFHKQWTKLHRYANEKGISIIGDVPIYVPYDSVDVWSDPELFRLDAELAPIAVAGCPPDAFSEDGQLWGNPLYRWEVHAKEGYRWWLRRLDHAGRLYDIVRVDHFRGFEAYWSVPYGDGTAKNGQWIKGPAMEFVNAVKKALPNLELIAEDLGFLTKEVLDMRDKSGWPGMKILQFAYDPEGTSDYLPYRYPKNCVCYTGTHDNMTTAQWLETAPEAVLEFAKAFTAPAPGETLTRGILRTAMASVADTCVIPLQDWLELDGSARMNFPGTQTGENWTWRVREGSVTESLAQQICAMTRLYGRLNPKNNNPEMETEI